MRWRTILVAGALVLNGFATTTVVQGEPLKYYRWTDDEGTHMSDTPPKEGDYETLVIDSDTNVMSSPGAVSGRAPDGRGPDSESGSSGARSGERLPDSTEGAIAEEEQRRLDGSDPEDPGWEPAPGAGTADSSATAPAAGPAAGAATGADAAAAPGAALPPVFPGP